MSVKRGGGDQGNNGNNERPVNPAMADALNRAGASGSNNGNQNTQQGQEHMQNNPGQGQRPGAAPQPNGRRRGSIVDVNSEFRRPVSRNSSGEQVQKYKEALSKAMAANLGDQYGDAFRLLVLDNNQHMVPFSSILVCYHEKTNGVEHVAVYTLIIESSGSKLNNIFVNIGGTQVEVEVATGDVYLNKAYWEVIERSLLETYGRELQIHDAGGLVLPTELEATDAERIRFVFFNATQAAFTVMDNVLGGAEPPFTVANVGQGDQLTARLDFGSVQAENAVGLPVRSDICLTLQGQVQSQTQLGFQQQRDLSRVCGYVDLVFAPPPPVGFGQQPITQTYFPRFVITKSDTEIDAITMELQLLALSSTTLLSRGMAWASTFKPVYTTGVDLHDIGAIGYEVNLDKDPAATPKRIGTKDEAFGLPQLQQLIGLTIHDALLYSMDIEEVGELSWIHQTYIAAANGDQAARQTIIEAADNLSLQHFSGIFPANEPICIDDGNRVILGYYIGQDGEQRDLRDIDYLALLNLAGKDHVNVVEEWENTYAQTDIPLEIRLERRIKILKGVISGKLVIKGFARRITFNPNFIIALNQANERAGLQVRPGNLVETFSQHHVRGGYNAGQFAVNSAQVGGMFNYSTGFGGQRGGGMFGSPFTGRFGR